ncbi:nuclear pore complex protein NUP98A isoform X2 [Vigna unguiculata]|uniref:Nucleoporin autopeptidase n=1 Tax=Vigna unguiculata TaxID=3917 RepID=A0A4D6N8S5_VIGUN|nr:nuclear pore complex protein NUP98A isoform X2 [Vigna unguiculata]QCE10230.1 nuclear pore complex protein [Vigna unguiculata]
MFGSNPFGQSSSSPFGSQSVFGQTNSSTNPFAPKPFGSTSPFGSQTGSSMFGGTSTGVFGAAQQSSPFASNTAFGASSSPAFGSSVPAFGSSSTPAFGSSSSSFGGSSVFGQKPAFGGFGSTPTQTSPFGATQQSQPGFGSSIFGSSTPFGGSSQPAFGATSTPAFGATSTPAFGATSTPAFGASSTPAFGASSTPAFGATSTPAFGATSSPAFGATSTPAFGSTSSPTFGSTGGAFGVSSAPVFGGGGAFGASSNPMFGSSSTSAFGSSSTPFGASSTPAFGASSAPAFSFGSTQAFGQSSSAFGSSSPFGSTASPFGGQSSAFGSQTPSSTFGNTGIGQPGFGGQQRGGSRVTSYTATIEADSGTSGQTAKLESISAMAAYKDKSHEELRWEDYQLGDKGGPLPSGQSTGLAGFSSSTTQTNAFSPSPVFGGQSSANPFSSTTPNSNPFAPKSSPFSSGFGTSAAPAFSSSAFGSSTSAAAPSIFGSSPSPFGANSSSTPSFGQSPSLFNTAPAQTSSPFGSSIFGNTQSSPLFSSAAPPIAQTGSAFGQNTSPFGQTTPFSQSSLFNSPSSGLVGSIFSSSASLTSNNLTGFGQTAPSISTPFQPAQPAQLSGAFGFSNFGQTQPGGASSFGGTPGLFGQNNFGLPSSTQNAVAVQAVPNTNPFGTLPAMPQMSIGRVGTTPSIQYGISSMPALDKPAPVRISSLLTSRHLSQRRIRLPVRKYHSKNDGPRVPFFSDDEDTTTTPKADALFIPRENPRALIISPMEQWPAKASEKAITFKDRSIPGNENGNISKEASVTPHRTSSQDKDKDKIGVENGVVKEQGQHSASKPMSNGNNEDHSSQKADMYKTLSGHRAGEAAIVYEHGADVEALMPKLRRSDYYTLPRIHELAAKERAEPGFCSHVKDFVVGRQGYGSIRFLGETDVRGLDLESLIQFNNREVIVYMDDSKKPPVGQGLNKPAEVTLLNIKCFDKKTGHQYTEGPKIEKYKEMLKRKAEDQGAEFVSYDPTKGEWKIRVNHFSVYKLLEEDVNTWINHEDLN